MLADAPRTYVDRQPTSGWQIGPWSIAVALLFLATGCAMRVTGVVRDQSTGNPIGGAVVAADDGRNRMCVTDPAGRYAIKTDRQQTALTVSAPSYQTTRVAVPGDSGSAVADVDLQPIARGPTAESWARPMEPGSGGVGTADDGPAAKFRQLQDLRERGLISDEEYHQTRKRFIGGL